MKTLLLTGAALAGLLGPGCGRSTCVARGTRIRRRDGEVAVEQISIGDEVLCLDPARGERAYGRVSALTVGRRECIDLVFGSRTLTVTTDHPLYCPDTSQ